MISASANGCAGLPNPGRVSRFHSDGDVTVGWEKGRIVSVV
jgi:hypothetical protein